MTAVRRVGAGTAVLLLHLALLSAFLFAHYARTALHNPTGEIEIRFAPARTRPNPTVPPALQPQFLSPTAPLVPASPGQLSAPVRAPSPAPDTLSGVGRALFGCNPGKLDLLSPQDRAACLRLPRAKSSPASIRMPPPPDPNSPFSQAIEERFREATPINRPCPLGSFNDTHGLPCFGFPGERTSPAYAPRP